MAHQPRRGRSEVVRLKTGSGVSISQEVLSRCRSPPLKTNSWLHQPMKLVNNRSDTGGGAASWAAALVGWKCVLCFSFSAGDLEELDDFIKFVIKFVLNVSLHYTRTQNVFLAVKHETDTRQNECLCQTPCGTIIVLIWLSCFYKHWKPKLKLWLSL